MLGKFLVAISVFAFAAVAIVFFEALDMTVSPDRHFESKYPILKFSTFLSLYALNPDSWSLQDDYVVKYGQIGEVLKRDCCLYRHNGRSGEFGFSKKDTKKYVKWLRNKRSEEETAKKKAKTEAALTWLISESEKEIAAIRELAAQEHKNAKETYENILRKEQEN